MARWVRGIAAATVVCALGACSSTATTHKATNPVPSPPTTSAAPGPTDEGPTPTVTTEVSIGALQLHLQPGWVSGTGDRFGNLCVEPPGKHPEVFGCGGLDIWFGWDSYLPGEEMAPFDPAHPGWYHATDVQPCPVKPTDGPDHLNGIREHGRVPTAPTYASVGGRTAYFFQWRAHCDNGYRFSPRAWYLPQSKILIFDYVGTTHADALLQTATFDTGRWTLGFFRGFSRTDKGVRLNYDEALWLSGEAAAYYARHHGMHDVPDDYLLVDPDTSTIPVTLSPTAHVISTFQLAGTSPGTVKTVSVTRLLTFLENRSNWSTPFHVHVDASGVIDQVEEQYRP